MDDGFMRRRRKFDERCIEPSASMNSCELAVTMRTRMRGLLRREPDSGMIILAPCRAIHTFGMAYPIDVAFIGYDGCVLSVFRCVGHRRYLHDRRAVAVIERFSSDDRWFAQGDYLKFLASEVAEQAHARTTDVLEGKQ